MIKRRFSTPLAALAAAPALFPFAGPPDDRPDAFERFNLSGKGKVYVCEYSRQIDNGGFNGLLPGRILELTVKDRSDGLGRSFRPRRMGEGVRGPRGGFRAG